MQLTSLPPQNGAASAVPFCDAFFVSQVPFLSLTRIMGPQHADAPE